MQPGITFLKVVAKRHRLADKRLGHYNRVKHEVGNE